MGKFPLCGLREGNQDEALHLCSAAAATGSGKRCSSSGEMLPGLILVGASRQGQGRVGSSMALPQPDPKGEQRGLEQKGSILSLLSPRNWDSLLGGGGHGVSPSLADRREVLGVRLLHPLSSFAISSAVTHPDTQASWGFKMPHTSW